MAVRKARAVPPDVREYLAREHAAVILKLALELEDGVQVARSRRYLEAVRGGMPLRIHWYELPAGAFPQSGHNPCDDVIVDSDDTIRWAED